MKTLIYGVVVISSLATVVGAQVPDLGLAGNYGVVATGDRIRVNSGPNTGDFLLGQGVNAAFSGGGNGAIVGTLFFDNTVAGTNTFNQLAVNPSTISVSTSLTLQAQNDAIAASVAAEALVATQTFGSLSGTVTINGNGGLNVIHIASLSNATVTLNGSTNDIFVFNVAGNFSTNRTFSLNGGIAPDALLFNLLGSSGNIFQTSGGNQLFGTFLSTRGGDFNFSNLNLTGALINTAGEIGIVSGSRVNYVGFVPTPGTAGVLGLASLLACRRRR